MIEYKLASSEDDIALARTLFTEYGRSLNFSLCFQDFDQELAGLPGDYASPDGRLILVYHRQTPVGCVALRKIDYQICEMKRLYVRPEFRGEGFGRALAETALEEAKKIGYRFMRLDTVPEMKEAISLYESIGFKRIPPYRDNPVPGAIYLEIDLANFE
ncbi:MAG: GNAT family N-acetyltransferase [bacterium]|jgi:ribosomal protein S18 acetylase RimI-like enzyme